LGYKDTSSIINHCCHQQKKIIWSVHPSAAQEFFQACGTLPIKKFWRASKISERARVRLVARWPCLKTVRVLNDITLFTVRDVQLGYYEPIWHAT